MWAVAACALTLSACSLQPVAGDGRLLGLVTPYRIDIVEGNAVTREQAALVKPGMTRAQVRDLLGSPMLTDPFHGNRWDYLFAFRRAGEPLQRRSVVAHFEGDLLARLEVPAALPSEEEFVAAIDPPSRRPARPTALELTPEQRAALPAPAKPAATATAPLGSTRTYPPLEP